MDTNSNLSLWAVVFFLISWNFLYDWFLYTQYPFIRNGDIAPPVRKFVMEGSSGLQSSQASRKSGVNRYSFSDKTRPLCITKFLNHQWGFLKILQFQIVSISESWHNFRNLQQALQKIQKKIHRNQFWKTVICL